MSESQLQITSAEDYAKLEDSDSPAEPVPMPSSAVFLLRRVDIKGLALMGELPMSLVAQGVKAWRQQGLMPAESQTQEPEDADDADKTIQHLIFVRQLVVDNCLQPRIGYDELGIVSLLDANGRALAKLQKKDFLYALQWITSQMGVEAGRLSNFLNGQGQQSDNAGANGQELRDTPVVPIEA